MELRFLKEIGGNANIAEWIAQNGLTGHFLTIDHIVPKQQGGTNDPSNLPNFTPTLLTTKSEK